MKGLILAALCGLLAACQSPTGSNSGQVVRISPRVWSYYQEYAHRPGPLYFAVSVDGEYAGYNYCLDATCPQEFTQTRGNALHSCQELSGQECLIFAHRGDIKVPYEIKP